MIPDTSSGVMVRTPHLTLRRLRPSDAIAIQNLADDWEVAKQTANLAFPYDIAEAREFIERAVRAGDAGKEFIFAIVRNEGSVLVGLIGIVADVAPMEVGYWLGRDYWGQGYASEGLHAVLNYCRETLYSRIIDAVVFEENAASIRVLSKCGFQYQDRWEEDMPHRGGTRTILRYQWRAP